MNNQALYNNCKRFVELSELDSDKWTQPIQSEYQELIGKPQSGHSIVINNCDRNQENDNGADEELIRSLMIDVVSAPINQSSSRITDLEVFLPERLGYQSKGHTF